MCANCDHVLEDLARDSGGLVLPAVLAAGSCICASAGLSVEQGACASAVQARDVLASPGAVPSDSLRVEPGEVCGMGLGAGSAAMQAGAELCEGIKGKALPLEIREAQAIAVLWECRHRGEHCVLAKRAAGGYRIVYELQVDEADSHWTVWGDEGLQLVEVVLA